MLSFTNAPVLPTVQIAAARGLAEFGTTDDVPLLVETGQAASYDVVLVVQADPEVRVIVLSGAGPSFSAGSTSATFISLTLSYCAPVCLS